VARALGLVGDAGLSVIAGSYAAGVGRLLFRGSSCIYPKLAAQPIREEALLTGPLEPTNEAYALAEIAGIVQIQSIRRQYGASYISAMPTNLYGPGDNFDLQTSHVLPALIRRFHEAKHEGAAEVTLWGSGTPRREFLHVDDLAAACVLLLRSYDDDAPVNVGCGEDLTIRELARRYGPSSDTAAASPGTHPGPTARRESYWTSPASPRSAGSRPSHCARGSPPSTRTGRHDRPRNVHLSPGKHTRP
jgi:nucleoside-diphosphate-sugar epimerase